MARTKACGTSRGEAAVAVDPPEDTTPTEKTTAKVRAKKTSLAAVAAKKKPLAKVPKVPGRVQIIPQAAGSSGQEASALALFSQFQDAGNLSWPRIGEIWRATKLAQSTGSEFPELCIYKVLEHWVLFLFNHSSPRSKNSNNVLSQGTADNYLSQIKKNIKHRFAATDLSAERCTSIRNQLTRCFTERATQLQIVSHQAPAMTVNDMTILGDTKSIHVACTLSILWHLLGRAVDSAWLTRKQLCVMSDGDIFVNFTRLKTSSLQGVSLYPHKNEPFLCPFLAFAVLLVTSGPSALCIALVKSQDVVNQPTLEVGAISQLEASLLGVADDLDDKPDVAARKRPSVAQLLNHELKVLEAEYKESGVAIGLGSVGLTPGLQSHSVRRGGAQCASSSPKLTIQGISTRGHWSLDALSKAFAYIGTTLQDDQRIARRLAGWDPDDVVTPPSLDVLKASYSKEDQERLHVFKELVFSNARNFTGDADKCNVSDAVCNSLFATLLMHLPMLHALNPESVFNIKINRAIQDSRCTFEFLTEASDKIRSKFQSTVPLHECKTCNIAMLLREMSSQFATFNSKIDQLQREVRELRSGQVPPASSEATARAGPSVAPTSSVSESLAAYNVQPAAFLYKWYTEMPWTLIEKYVDNERMTADEKMKKKASIKADQTKLSQLKKTLAIMKFVAQVPFKIGLPGDRQRNPDGYNHWKTDVYNLSVKIETAVYANFTKSLDKKTTASGASSLITRFKHVLSSDIDMRPMLKVTKDMLANQTLLDAVTPEHNDGLLDLLERVAKTSP